MQIECTIRRKNGSTSVMPLAGGKNVTYRFIPRDKDGNPVPNTKEEPENYKLHPHVCDVTVAKHARTLLNIRAYVPFGDAALAEATERFGYGEEEDAELPTDNGQPPVTDEFVDDDEDSGTEDDGPKSNPDADVQGDDADPAAGNEPDGENSPEIDLETHAVENFPGVTDAKNRDQLEKYAKENYGVDLDKRKGHKTLIKQIIRLANQSDA